MKTADWIFVFLSLQVVKCKKHTDKVSLVRLRQGGSVKSDSMWALAQIKSFLLTSYAKNCERINTGPLSSVFLVVFVKFAFLKGIFKAFKTNQNEVFFGIF